MFLTLRLIILMRIISLMVTLGYFRDDISFSLFHSTLQNDGNVVVKKDISPNVCVRKSVHWVEILTGIRGKKFCGRPEGGG